MIHTKRTNEVILDDNNKWLTQVNYAFSLEANTPFSPLARAFYMKAVRNKASKACSNSWRSSLVGDMAIAQRLFDDPQIQRACASSSGDRRGRAR